MEFEVKPRIVLEHILYILLRSNFYGGKLKVCRQVSCHLSCPCSWMDWYASGGHPRGLYSDVYKYGGSNFFSMEESLRNH